MPGLRKTEINTLPVCFSFYKHLNAHGPLGVAPLNARGPLGVAPLKVGMSYYAGGPL